MNISNFPKFTLRELSECEIDCVAGGDASVYVLGSLYNSAIGTVNYVVDSVEKTAGSVVSTADNLVDSVL